MKVWYGVGMDLEAKNYELAYVLSPTVPEDAVLTEAEQLTALISDAGGIIKRSETPKKRRLAYPIQKATSGYFAWISFSMAPAAVAALEKKIKEHKNLLRHLIVEEEIETRVPYVRPQGVRRAPAMQKTAPSPMSAPEQPPEEKLDLETLDKKLEEILGK